VQRAQVGSNLGPPPHGIAASDRAVQPRQALQFAGTRFRTWDTQVDGQIRKPAQDAGGQASLLKIGSP